MRKQYPESKERWNKENPEKVRASVMKYYWKNREQILQVQKEWRRKNSEYPQKYYEENRDRKIDSRATEVTLKKVLNANFLRFGLTCCENCHTSIWDRYEFDHIIPVVLGGSGDYDNIQILCKPCNREKFTNAIDFRQYL